MSFFSNIEQTNTFESGGGSIEPIPDNTNVLAAIDQAVWQEDRAGGASYIEFRWSVMAPAEYANRKVFQKVRVRDEDAKKAEKAKRMLVAIDANAGGKIFAGGKEPTEQDLQKHLMAKPMVLRVQIWEIEGKVGNWVSAVSARKGGAAPAPAPAVEAGGEFDDVPF